MTIISIIALTGQGEPHRESVSNTKKQTKLPNQISQKPQGKEGRGSKIVRKESNESLRDKSKGEQTNGNYTGRHNNPKPNQTKQQNHIYVSSRLRRAGCYLRLILLSFLCGWQGCLSLRRPNKSD